MNCIATASGALIHKLSVGPPSNCTTAVLLVVIKDNKLFYNTLILSFWLVYHQCHPEYARQTGLLQTIPTREEVCNIQYACQGLP